MEQGGITEGAASFSCQPLLLCFLTEGRCLNHLLIRAHFFILASYRLDRRTQVRVNPFITTHLMRCSAVSTIVEFNDEGQPHQTSGLRTQDYKEVFFYKEREEEKRGTTVVVRAVPAQ